jgi:hypothetical protein
LRRFIVMFVVALCFSVRVIQAQETAPEISPALLEQIEGIEDYVIETRGLEELNPVERVFPSRQDAIDYILNLYEQEYPEEVVWQLAQFYIAFDLLPPDTDYLESYLSLLSAQIGGFYEPETKQMNTLLLSGEIIDDELPLLEQIVYSHEYTHALQDQHFDLTATQALAGENRDYMQAILSLIEGDATIVMNLYTQAIAEKNPLGTALQLLAQGIQTNTLTLPAGTPPVIESELLSAYLDGSVFVSALIEAGGWEAVNAAFADPPQSTEQILHPQKYLDGEVPQEISLVDSVLGDDWEIIWDNTMGEFYLREYLQTQLTSAEANPAAAGWGGDNYHIFYNAETDQLAWVMAIAWDTEDDAAEFNESYIDFGALRFEKSSDNGCWSDESGALCMSEGEFSHLLAFAPDIEMARAIIQVQSQREG